MMKRKANKKRVIRIILFSVAFSLIAIWVFILAFSKSIKNPETNFVYDKKELFSDSQEMLINTTSQNVQRKYKVKVYVSTCSRSYGSALQVGTGFLREHNFSSEDNIVVIIINATDYESNYHFDIYTYGDSARKISGDWESGELHKILYCEGGDLVLTSNSDNATRGVIEMIEKTGMAYAWILADMSWWIICGVSLAIGCLVAFLIVKAIKKSYSKNRKSENYEFTSNTNLNLRIKQDTFIRKSVSSVRIERSHSSGGGSSGRSFSGGGRSGGGGGGGHRGGR